MTRRVSSRGSIVVVCVVVLAFAVAACKPINETGSPTGTEPVVRGAGLTLGVEYAPPQVASAFRDSGAVLAKPYPELGNWRSIEPAPGAYDWRTVDTFVRSYQQAGFTQMNLMLSARSDWANVDPPQPPLHRGRSELKPEYEDDFTAYVQAYVERYDADGIDDMPGLTAPVLLYGLEPEFSSYVPGDAREYLRLLELAHPAVKRANPGAQLMNAGLLMTTTFDGYPTANQVAERLANPDSRIFDKTAADIGLLLDRPDLFDVLDFHSLGDYTEIIPTIAWLRAEMARRGYDRPIWIGDAWGGTTLNGWGPATCTGPISGTLIYPAQQADRCRIATALAALSGSAEPAHSQALTWIRADSAAGIVRKVVVAAGEGAAGINIGNVEDWEPLMLTAGGAGTSPWQGMIDRSWPLRQFQGYRSSFYALQQVADLIDAYHRVTRIDMQDPRLYAYRFDLSEGEQTIVAWADNGLWLPGGDVPVVQARIATDWQGPVQAEWTVTEGTVPFLQTLAPTAGVIEIELGPVPVFLSLIHG